MSFELWWRVGPIVDAIVVVVGVAVVLADSGQLYDV